MAEDEGVAVTTGASQPKKNSSDEDSMEQGAVAAAISMISNGDNDDRHHHVDGNVNIVVPKNISTDTAEISVVHSVATNRTVTNSVAGTSRTSSSGGERSNSSSAMSGMSLILMVNQMLKTADEKTRESYVKGKVVEHPDGVLSEIYKAEKVAASSIYNYSMAWTGQSVSSSSAASSSADTTRSDTDDIVDLQFAEPIVEQVAPLPPDLDPATDPFTPRTGQSLTWQNVDMVLKASAKAKRKGMTDRKLLDKVWGEVPPKETTAIMGASGAGKTSLLNILAGRVHTSGNIKVSADVRLDNYSVDPTNISVRKLIAFVAQDDSLMASATAREAISFSARLRLPRSTTPHEIELVTNRMLSELGLTSCADTYIGGPLLKGISGGERKRTSVGVELIVKPAMIFLDEPTSGLDSFSAVQVCQVLKKVANAGASVLFTIHQPSSEIFFSFDHVILLNKGRVMFQGSTESVAPIFAGAGYPCPANYNPADWIMNVAQATPVSELGDAGFFATDHRNIGEPSVPGPGMDPLGRTIDKKKRKAEKELHVGSWIEFQMLFYRDVLKVLRDYYSFGARILVSLFQALLIGCVFYQVGATDSADFYNLQSHFGAFVIMLVMCMLGTAGTALLNFPEERPIFLREYSTNHYQVTPYFLARLAMEFLIVGFQIMVITIVIFFLVALTGRYSVIYGLAYATSMVGTAMAVMIGCSAGGNGRVALQLAPVIFVPNMLLSGFFVSPDLIPVWLRWIRYFCVMTYSLRIALLEEFYDCSLQTHSKDQETRLAAKNCEGLLENIGVNYDDNWWYWVAILLLFLLYRTIAIVMLYRSTRFFE